MESFHVADCGPVLWSISVNPFHSRRRTAAYDENRRAHEHLGQADRARSDVRNTMIRNDAF
jgi:hypothetical protein